MKCRFGVALLALLTFFYLWFISQCLGLTNLPSTPAVVFGLLGLLATVVVAPWTYSKLWGKFIAPKPIKTSGDTNE